MMEIDEREDRPVLSSPSKKDRSPSPDGGTAEGEPKRRKHHHRHRNHRHHHRHRHRHNSKKDKENDEGDKNKERLLDDEMGVANEIRMVEDGELEEGEILEDGEIKPERDSLVCSLVLSVQIFFFQILKHICFCFCWCSVSLFVSLGFSMHVELLIKKRFNFVSSSR